MLTAKIFLFETNSNTMNEPQTLNATLVEIGDDEDGMPRLIFHTTREEIMRLKKLPLYQLSRVTIEPIQTTEETE